MKTGKILAAILSMSMVLSSAAASVSAAAVILGTDQSGNDIIGGIYDELAGFNEEGKPIIVRKFPEGFSMDHLPDDALVNNENYIYIIEYPDSEESDMNSDGGLITDAETVKIMIEEFIGEKGWRRFTRELTVVPSEKGADKVFVEFIPVDDIDEDVFQCRCELYDYCRENNLDQSVVETVMYINETYDEEKCETVRTNLLKLKDIIAENGWQDCTEVYYYSGKFIVEFRQTEAGENDDNMIKLSQLSYASGIDTKLISESSSDIQDTAENVPDETEIGDINLDGSVDLTDLSELALTIVGDKNLTEEQLVNADINSNGKADLADLARLRQYLSKAVTSLR